MNDNDKELDLSEAYQKYFNTIRRYVAGRLRCDTALAEEATSDIFFLLQTRWDELTSHKSQVISTWLYRTANYTINDYKRKIWKQSATADWEAAVEQEATKETDIQDIHEKYDYELLLQKIKGELKEKEWILFEALYINKTPTADIAKLLHISNAAVYLRKARLEQRLRAILGRK